MMMKVAEKAIYLCKAAVMAVIFGGLRAILWSFVVGGVFIVFGKNLEGAGLEIMGYTIWIIMSCQSFKEVIDNPDKYRW